MNWQRLRRKLWVRGGLLLLMTALLLLIAYRSLITGEVDVDREVALKVALDEAPFGYHSDLDYANRFVERDAKVIRNIRLPRIFMASLTGLALALGGAGLQGVFRNPLVEPGLIGVSSGAAMGAVTVLLLNLEDRSPLILPVIAFVAGVLTTLLVYRMAYQYRRTNTLNLLLIGLAINSIAGAFIGVAMFAGNRGPLAAGEIVLWTLGSIGGTQWEDVRIVAPFILFGAVFLPLLAHQLNLMALGETEARHLGVNVARLRLVVILLSALMVGVSVAFVGIIGFVGLVVPHLIRLLFGPDHRLLLPASALGGAIFVMGMDVAAVGLASPTEIPIGALTTLIGGPFFLALILFSRR